MEIENVRQQLEDLLTLFEDDQKSTDDIVFGTLTYLKNAHLVAQFLLLEGRFAEMQRCLDLCRSAFVDVTFPGLMNTCPKAVSHKLARMGGQTNHGGPGCPSPVPPSSIVESLRPQSQRSRTPFRDCPSVSSFYNSIARVSEFSVPLSTEDRRLLEALQDRTAMLQRQCDYSRDVRPGRDTQYYIKKLRLQLTQNEAEAVKESNHSPPERGVSIGRRTKLNQYKMLRDLPPLVTSADPFFNNREKEKVEAMEDDAGAANVKKLYRALQEKSDIIDPDWDEDEKIESAEDRTPLYMKEVNPDILLSPVDDPASLRTVIPAPRSVLQAGNFSSGSKRKADTEEFRDRAPLFVPQPKIPLPEIKKHIMGYKRRSLTESYTAMRAHRSPSTGLTPYRAQSPDSSSYDVQNTSVCSPVSNLAVLSDWRIGSQSTMCVDEEEEDFVDGDIEIVESGRSWLTDNNSRSGSVVQRRLSSSASLSPAAAARCSAKEEIVARSMRQIRAAQRAMRQAENHLSVIHNRSDSLIDYHYVINRPKPFALQPGVKIMPLLFSSQQHLTDSENVSPDYDSQGQEEAETAKENNRPQEIIVSTECQVIAGRIISIPDTPDKTHSNESFPGDEVNVLNFRGHQTAMVHDIDGFGSDSYSGDLTPVYSQHQRRTPQRPGFFDSTPSEGSVTRAPSMRSDSLVRPPAALSVTTAQLLQRPSMESVPMPQVPDVLPNQSHTSRDCVRIGSGMKPVMPRIAPNSDSNIAIETPELGMESQKDARSNDTTELEDSDKMVFLDEKGTVVGVETPPFDLPTEDVPVEVRQLEEHLQLMSRRVGEVLGPQDHWRLLAESPYHFDEVASELVREHLVHKIPGDGSSFQLGSETSPNTVRTVKNEALTSTVNYSPVSERLIAHHQISGDFSGMDSGSVLFPISSIGRPIGQVKFQEAFNIPAPAQSSSSKTERYLPAAQISKESSPSSEGPPSSTEIPKMALVLRSTVSTMSENSSMVFSPIAVTNSSGWNHRIKPLLVAPLRMTTAAFRIQCAWRRHSSRMRRERRKMLVGCLMEKEEIREAAAVVIQTAVRCYFASLSCRRLIQEQDRDRNNGAASQPLQLHGGGDASIPVTPMSPRNHENLLKTQEDVSSGYFFNIALYDVPPYLRGTARSIALRRLQKQLAARVIVRAYRHYRVISQDTREAKAMLLFVTGKCSQDYVGRAVGLDDPLWTRYQAGMSGSNTTLQFPVED